MISALSNANTSYRYNYSFDPIGNRQTAALAGTSWSYTSNNLNQYTALEFGSTTQNPTYDFDGNMLTRDGWIQAWNGENRLIEMIKGDTRLTFAYDYLGRRVEKKIFKDDNLTKHIKFVYYDYKLIESLDSLNQNITLRKYTWQPESLGLDVPLSVYDVTMNATYFYVTDANKNISELIDGEGNVVAHYEYSPFGALTAAIGTYATINPFRFSSEYYDSETGLVYYNYRYYSPNIGRWLSRDPIQELGGSNLYSYCMNRNYLYDIIGLCSFWDRLKAGFVGALTGAGSGALTGAAVGAGVGFFAGGVGAGPGALAGAGAGAIGGGISGFIAGFTAGTPGRAAVAGAVSGVVTGATGGAGAAGGAAWGAGVGTAVGAVNGYFSTGDSTGVAWGALSGGAGGFLGGLGGDARSILASGLAGLDADLAMWAYCRSRQMPTDPCAE